MLACELRESKVCARLMVRGMASMATAVSRRATSSSSSAALRAGCRYDIRLQHAWHWFVYRLQKLTEVTKRAMHTGYFIPEEHSMLLTHLKKDGSVLAS